MIDSKDESFFLVDSETMSTLDTSVIMDFSMVFVDMARIHDLHRNVQGDKLEPLPFGSFLKLPHVKTISVFPDIKEQFEIGSTKDERAVKFWKEQLANTNNIKYKEYIKKLFSVDGKDGVMKCIEEIEEFIRFCLVNSPNSTITDREIFFLERSGGFDTNKYYNMLYRSGLGFDHSLMKYYNRREIRTIISANRYRMPKGVISLGTTNWSDGVKTMISNEMKDEFVPHIAINDCLIDAYMIYLLKISVENFYL